jgi:hypothetical protein
MCRIIPGSLNGLLFATQRCLGKQNIGLSNWATAALDAIVEPQKQ